MSFKKAKSRKDWNSTSNTNTNSLTTPIMPDWATSAVRRGTGLVEEAADLDPKSLVAPAHALQNQAGAGAAGLGQWTPSHTPGLPRDPGDTSWLSRFANADTPFASGGKAYNYVDRYLNPYLQNVVDSSAADFDADAGRTRAQQALDLAGSGAFGGSGAALTQSMTEGELARARASTLSGLRSRAYDTALGAAAGDADRATQARIANAQTNLQDRAQKIDLGFRSQAQQLAVDENARANIATQAGLGDTFRAIDSEYRMAPLVHKQQVAAMLGGLPLDLFRAEQKTETSNQVQSGTERVKESSYGLNVEELANAAATAYAKGGAR